MGILSVRGALPDHRYPQEEITDAFAGVIATAGGLDERLLRRVPRATPGCEQRHLVLPLEEYGGLDGLRRSANDLFIEHAVELGVPGAGRRAQGRRADPGDVDLVDLRDRDRARRPVPRRADRRRRSGCGPTSSGCRWSGSAASPAPPGSPGCTTTWSATPTTSRCWSPSSCAR